MITLCLTALVWLPISMRLIGSVFDGVDYALAYLLFMGLALPLGTLAAAAAYQFTRRADLSIVLFAGIRERLAVSDMPKWMDGFPGALITAGLMSLAFQGFSGLIQ